MSNYAPTPDELAVTYLMARTRDPYGNLLGTFTTTTSVSPEQAQAAIDEAVDEVAGEVGDTVPDDFVSSAKRMVELLAAANIEMSYFPEQAAGVNSMYDKLMARYNSLVASAGGEVGEEDFTPDIDFPAPDYWMTRRL
jgi:hypothetical protein